MGIVKISDELHEELRNSSQVMMRSINSQAEFWIKIGRLAELNPTLTFNEIFKAELLKNNSDMSKVFHERDNDKDSQRNSIDERIGATTL